MEQTFTDLCNEKRKTNQGLFGFVLLTLVETAIGIIREYRLLVLSGGHMQTLLTNLKLPALIGFLLVLPLMIMEVVNRRSFNEGLPFPLFVILWLLPVLFTFTIMPVVRNVRAGNSIAAHAIGLLIRVIFLAFIAWIWFGILIDQIPCFLGVPNCD